jgi:predicted O-linked N-acetylglucosamine transferase (SPINDLY family)
MSNPSTALQTAIAHHRGGSLETAERLYGEILRKHPKNADAYHLLGLIAFQKRDFPQAAQLIQKALSINQSSTLFMTNLAKAYEELGEDKKAVALYGKAIEMDPNQHEIHFRLGNALRKQKDMDQAIRSYRAAIRAKPDYFEAYNNLGAAYAAQGSIDTAIECFSSALRIKPDWADGHNNLGLIYSEHGQSEEALRSFTAASELKPGFAGALINSGKEIMLMGDLASARTCFSRAKEAEPGNPIAADNLLFCDHYDPSLTREQIAQSHLAWGSSIEALIPPLNIHPNKPDPQKRLRIGYVSPDFYRHPVAYFVEPVLWNHNHNDVAVICYSDARRFDDLSGRMKLMVDVWRDTSALSNEQLFALIIDDKIDILVDLAGHSAGNRLAVFACKPAPVQVSYLGYAGTTGLRAIDYYLTDDLCDPAGSEPLYAEQLVRFSSCFCCYSQQSWTPPLTPLPALTNGYCTFGSMHNPIRLNREVIALWSEALNAVPLSRLLIFRSLLPERTRTRIRDEFTGFAIEQERIEFSSEIPSGGTYLDAYGRIDISLDTFPWSGHTTACESLIMGVPVVTLAGDRHAGRMVASVLQTTGLPDLIAHDKEEFVRIARTLSADLAKLSDLRAGLRTRITQSPLCDAKRITTDLESAFRKIWRQWCEPQTRSSEQEG